VQRQNLFNPATRDGNTMAQSRLQVCVVAALLADCTGAFAQQRTCQQAGSDQGVVLGTLGLLEGLGPAAFIVTVPGGMCLTGNAAGDTVEQALSVQLYSSTAEGFQELYRMVGEKVYVRGRISGLKTYQQKAPLLMEVIEIATR
jgi:hypothetical protein